MARPLRIEYPGAWYHVMNRGRRREEIYRTSRDYEVFIGVLKETAELLNLEVAAYCLMPNQYHLLLHTPDGNISRCMRHINGVYTQRINRAYKEDGQLFRGRYKAVVVAQDSHLLEVLRYIHKIPVRAGLVENTGDFFWSSHRGYTSRAKKWDWLCKDFLLAMFSPKGNLAKKAYRSFIEEQESDAIERFYSKKNMSSVMGGDDFKEWVKETFSALRFHREIPESNALGLDSAKVRRLVCQVFRVKEDVLMHSRRGKENQARDVAIYLQRKYCGQTLEELGKDYGITKYSTVSSAYERVKAKLPDDRKLSITIAKIENKLHKGQKKI